MGKVNVKVSQFTDAGTEAGTLAEGMRQFITNGDVVVVKNNNNQVVREFDDIEEFNKWLMEKFGVEF
jgi:hypothetical protein